MAQLARNAASDPEFRRWASQFDSLPSIDLGVRAQYVYRDEREEILRTPQFMVVDARRVGALEGDCDDVATLYAAITKVLGFRTQLLAIRYSESNPNFEHVLTIAYGPGNVAYFLDATVQPGTEMRWIEEMVEDV